MWEGDALVPRVSVESYLDVIPSQFLHFCLHPPHTMFSDPCESADHRMHPAKLNSLGL